MLLYCAGRGWGLGFPARHPGARRRIVGIFSDLCAGGAHHTNSEPSVAHPRRIRFAAGGQRRMRSPASRTPAALLPLGLLGRALLGAPSAGQPPAAGRADAKAGTALPADWVKALTWRCIGPANMGGRITALSVYEADPN